jgi:acetylornithine deacetylase/succinyl-diaminopimelate desuccinylase-like protein
MRRILIAGLLLIGVAAGVSLWLQRKYDEEDRSEQTTYIPKQAQITPEIERLQRYVRIDTSSPPGNEIAGARYLAELIEGAGAKAEIIESAPGRASVYARIKGRKPDDALLLLNHIDVMPADAKQWSHPPFAATIAFNMMYGRGTLDMKGIGMCELEAFLAIARSGRTPERDIVFLAEADEEHGGTYGMQWLVQHRPDVVAGVRYAINEGGITETQREQLTYFGIEVGTKMLVDTRVRAKTREQLEALRIALEPYMSPRDPDRVLPEVREFFRELAGQRIEQGLYLKDVDATIASGKFWLLQRPYKELTQNIVWARGVAVVDGAPSMEVLLYNLPDENPDARLGWLKDFIKPFGAEVAEVVTKTGPSPLSSRHTPMFALLEREIHREYGPVQVGTEVLAASSNDSRFLRPLGIQCYGLWPFPVDYFQTLGIHGVDERVRLDWYMQGNHLLKRVVESYAFEDLPR